MHKETSSKKIKKFLKKEEYQASFKIFGNVFLSKGNLQN
jgi:hypothetical protein